MRTSVRSKDIGKESVDKGRIRAEDGAEVTMARYWQVAHKENREEVDGSDGREKTTIQGVFSLLQGFTQAKDETTNKCFLSTTIQHCHCDPSFKAICPLWPRKQHFLV